METLLLWNRRLSVSSSLLYLLIISRPCQKFLFWIRIILQKCQHNSFRQNRLSLERNSSSHYLLLASFSLITSIPKPAHAAAFSTFAVSVGFTDSTLVPGFIPPELSPYHGSAVTIDNHHLLAPAHILEYDTGRRNYPTDNLKYM